MTLIKERTQSSHRISRPARPAPEPSPRSKERARPSPGPARLHGAALALILTAAFMVVLDFSIVNVALPSIEAELGFPPLAGRGPGARPGPAGRLPPGAGRRCGARRPRGAVADHHRVRRGTAAQP